MKKIATISSILFSKEQTVALKLQEQPYIILIPKSILAKYGINSDNLIFDLVLDNNRITLLGPTKDEPEAYHSAVGERSTLWLDPLHQGV